MACERIGQERLGAYCDRVREAFEAYVSSGGWWVDEEEDLDLDVEEGEGDSPVNPEDRDGHAHGSGVEGVDDVKGMGMGMDEDGRREGEGEDGVGSDWTDVVVTTDDHDVGDESHLGKKERDQVDQQVKKLFQGLEHQAQAQAQAHALAPIEEQHKNDEGLTYAQAAASPISTPTTGQATADSTSLQGDQDMQNGRGRSMSRSGNSRSPSPSTSPHGTAKERSPVCAPAVLAAPAAHSALNSDDSHSSTANMGTRAPPGLIPVSVVSAPTVTIQPPPLKETINGGVGGKNLNLFLSSAGNAASEEGDMMDVDLDLSHTSTVSNGIRTAVADSMTSTGHGMEVELHLEADGMESDDDAAMEMDAEIEAMRANGAGGAQYGQMGGKGMRVVLEVEERDGDDAMMRA